MKMKPSKKYVINQPAKKNEKASEAIMKIKWNKMERISNRNIEKWNDSVNDGKKEAKQLSK